MYKIINKKNNETIIYVSARKWDIDAMWRNRITQHLTKAGFDFKLEE